MRAPPSPRPVASAPADPGPRLAAHVPRLAGGVAAAGGTVTVEGSLLCADLSGFTRLTERFAALGRHGAEEVSTVLDATFTAILGPAIEAGGDVLFFGGDAATIAFSGNGHAERSVGAAAAMQRALAGIERPATAERVRLRMTIGVATGELVAALAGSAQQALVVVGPTAEEAVRLQHAGRPGQVLVASAGGSPRSLRWRTGGDLPVAAASPSPEPEPLAALVPPALRGLLDTAPGPGELRRTSTAFVLARGLDVPAGADPAATIGRIGQVVSAVESACERWGVCWLATDIGEGSLSFVLTAGAPLATEHDEERVVGAIGSILEGAPTGAVQMGAERGVVFAGDVGHPARRAWTVIGDSVNVAARLAGAAGPGQALVGPALRSAIPHLFDDATLTTLAVKGRRRPVAVARFDRPRPLRPPSTTSSESAFVGRDDELALLLRAWADAGRGHGRAVEVVGEAGMGKTRLLAELRHAVLDDDDGGGAGPDQVTVVVPDLYRAAAPYATAARLLRGLSGIADAASADLAGAQLATWVRGVAPHLLEWLPLVAQVADARVAPTAAVDRLDAEFVPDRRHDITVQLLAAARTEPWLVVVEDLHLVDEASQALLAAIARAAADRPWLVCTSRVGDPASPGASGIAAAGSATVLALGALPSDAAAELVLAAAEPVAVADDVLARIIDAAAGNPLFLEQLARHSTGVDPEVPDTVERVLAARIDTLAPTDRQLLRDLAVLGRGGPAAVAAAWLDRPDLVDPARWAPLRPFVEVGPGDDGPGDRSGDRSGANLRFRSDLMRAVAYQGLSVRRRRSLHAAVATHLRADLDPADDQAVGLLASHLLESGDAEGAWPVAVDAARRARARIALVDAAALYARALRLAPRLPDLVPEELAAVHEEHGDVCQSLGRFELALGAYRAAARLVDDPLAGARLCSRRAGVEQKRGALARASAWATRGLRLLDGAKGAAVAAARAQLALDQAATRHYQGRHRESIRWAERAAADALGTDDPTLLANAHLHLEMAHSMLGDGQAVGHGEKAVALFEELGDNTGLAHALINSGVTAYDEGRWSDARAAYERAAGVAATTGNVNQVATTELNTAFLLAELGEIDQAAALCASAGRAFRASGNELTLGFVDWLSARLALWAGDVGSATEHLAVARRRFDDNGARQMVLDCDVAAVEVLLVAGDDATAAAEAARLEDEVDAFGPAELLPITVRRLRSHAARRTGDALGALAAADAAVELARDHGARMELALSLDALAHARRALGQTPEPALVDERDGLLAGLGVRRTIFPLA